jgi:hypothetical protein
VEGVVGLGAGVEVDVDESDEVLGADSDAAGLASAVAPASAGLLSDDEVSELFDA